MVLMNRRSCRTSGSLSQWELIIRERWLQALSIDLQTGLDPPGFKVRAAQGLDAAVRLLRISSLQVVRIHSGVLDLAKDCRELGYSGI